MQVSQFVRIGLIGFLSTLTIVGCDKNKIVEGQTETKYVPHPPLETSMDAPKSYKKHQKLDLYTVVKANRGEVGFEVLSGNAELSRGGEIYFRETGTVVVRATVHNGGTTILTFKVDEALKFKRGEDSTSFMPRYFRIATRHEIPVEGGTPPYKYAITSLMATPAQSTIDDKGILRTAYVPESFYVTVTDAEGTAIKSPKFEVSKNMRDPLEHDAIWGTDGSIPGANKSLKDWVVSGDRKAFVTLNFDFNDEGHLPSSKVSKYTLDGQLDPSFALKGHYHFADPKFEFWPQQILSQKNGAILVVSYTQPYSRYATDEEKKEHFLARDIQLHRLTPSGKYDSQFKVVSLRSLMQNEDTNKHGTFEMRAQVFEDSIFVAVEAAKKTILMKLKPDGTLDTSFGNQGRAIIPDSTEIGALAMADGRVYVAGRSTKDRNGNDNIYETESKMVLLAYDWKSGNLDPKFATNGIATVDPKHRPAGTSLPFTNTKTILIDDNNIYVAGITWKSEFITRFNKAGKILDINVNKRSYNELSNYDLSLVQHKNQIIVVNAYPHQGINSSWVLELNEESQYFSEPPQEFLLPDLKFKNQYGAELNWWHDNGARILKLPDGSFLLTTTAGIVRLLPQQ